MSQKNTTSQAKLNTNREYMKKLDEDNVEKRVAFEASVSKLELVCEEEPAQASEYSV